jgi:peptidoglycan/xylan/chitin deacetylase (PgdA/CDA1 family)
MTNPIHSRMRSSIILSMLIAGIFLPTAFSNAQTISINADTYHPNNKVVFLTFGDTFKSQFTNAKPILDKYGLKGTFFVSCLWVGSHIYGMSRLTWQDVLALQNDGQNIGSKTMTHRRMTHLSPSDLSYEMAGSKKCMA